jgi:hypothetical protein
MAYLITNKSDRDITLSLRGFNATIKAGEYFVSSILVPTNPMFKLAKMGVITLTKVTPVQMKALNLKAELDAMETNTDTCEGLGCEKGDCCNKTTPVTEEVVTEEVVTEEVVTEEVVTEEVVTEEVVAEEVVTEEVVTEEVVTEEVVTEEVVKKKGKK